MMPEPAAPPFALTRGERTFVWILVGLAVMSRLYWVLVVHPPADYVFSDMGGYVTRAQDLVDRGFRFGTRSLAWMPFGTDHLLAAILWVFGRDALSAAAVVYGLYSASAPVTAYFLARRLFASKRIPVVVALGALVWHPNLSSAGYFLSEPPFLCFQLLATHALVVLAQTGRWAVWAGVCSAIAFAVRPQSAIFLMLAAGLLLVVRKRLPLIGARQLVGFALPVTAMLVFSLGRFYAHTGYFGGIAENATMNFTAGRCHNVVTQAFRTERDRAKSEAKANYLDGRRISLPGFRAIRAALPDEHPLGLRPANGDWTIRMVGTIGDPDLHRAIRADCYARTGFVEQLRYSAVNLMLSWFYAPHWPENERGRERFYPAMALYRRIYQVVFLVPSLLGLALVLRRARDHACLTLVALQLVTQMTTAAWFFGCLRLRAPYDVYAMILSAVFYAACFEGITRGVRAIRTAARARNVVEGPSHRRESEYPPPVPKGRPSERTSRSEQPVP